MSQFDTCRSCKVRIRWIMMPSGKRNPCDPAPNPDKGNIVIDREDEHGMEHGHVITKAEREAPADLFSDKLYALDGVDLYLSHFVTCPNRDAHRRT